MKKAIAILLFNIVLFFVLRLLNVTVLYLIKDSQIETLNGFWDYLPSYLIQVSVLMIIYLGKLRNDEHEGAYIYPVCVLVVTILYLIAYLKYIPDVSMYLQ